MKTLPIRCRSGDTRPIRAIAFEAASDAGDERNPSDEKKRDSCPTHQFIQEASRAMTDSWLDLANTLDETAKNGPPRNDTKFGFIADGIHEFKAWKLRVACFFDAHLIICTHGFYKKQQRTPKGELEKAKKFRTAYEEAKKREQLLHVEPVQQSPRIA